MAKEFKLFDKKYAKLMGTALKTIASTVPGHVIGTHFIAGIQRWPHFDRFTEDYSQSTVAYAVYNAPEADRWQQFRVSLKGLSTREKLYALSWYWNVNITPGAGAHLSVEAHQREIIRVNNYLGALKRSGHLDAELKVAKP